MFTVLLSFKNSHLIPRLLLKTFYQILSSSPVFQKLSLNSRIIAENFTKFFPITNLQRRLVGTVYKDEKSKFLGMNSDYIKGVNTKDGSQYGQYRGGVIKSNGIQLKKGTFRLPLRCARLWNSLCREVVAAPLLAIM